MVQQEGSKLEEDKIGLETKACLADQVCISERKNIIVNSLGENEGSISFYWHIEDERGKIINRWCINEGEMKLTDMQCIKAKGRRVADM
jgi:hypothetical protein